MIFKQVKTGGDRNFSYLIGDESSRLAAVVDPAYDPERMAEIAEGYSMTVRYLINTHGHSDHVNGNAAFVRLTGAQTVGHPLLCPNIPVEDGDELDLGKCVLRFIHTPGHSPDAICILVNRHLITGDTLFVGKVGGTGSETDARQLYDSLHRKILSLPDDVMIFPGHDYGTAPSSTIDNEKTHNPFILRESFEAFLDLKRNWAEYKKIHGIE